MIEATDKPTAWDTGFRRAAVWPNVFDGVEAHADRFRRYVAEGMLLHDAPRVLARIEASERLPAYPPCRCERCVAARGLA